MIKKILAAAAIIIVLFLLVVAFLPGDFRIARSTTIAAPPAVIFSRVNDVREFQKWSPWAKVDPQAKMTFTGPAAGTGASFSWESAKTGEGTMTVTESRPDEFVKFLLEFRKPFTATNTADFTFTPQGDQTLVTWGMSGKNNYLFRLVGVFMNMNKMVGDDFEKGLADLKILSETKP